MFLQVITVGFAIDETFNSSIISWCLSNLWCMNNIHQEIDKQQIHFVVQVIIVIISFNGLGVNLTLDFDYIPSFCELVTIMNLIMFISSWSNHVCFPLLC
jgi:hypothetical protein